MNEKAVRIMDRSKRKVRTKGDLILKIVAMNGGSISQEKLGETLTELGKKSNITPFRIIPTEEGYWLRGLRKKMRELEFMDYVKREEGEYRIEDNINLALPTEERAKIQETL